jgi:3-dehydroquinate synthetase
MDEARKVAHIINENAYLKIENNTLDSLLIYKDKTIYLLNENVEHCQTQVDNLTIVIDNNNKIVEIKDKEIIEIQRQCKKQKRKTMFTFGGGGVIAGILLTLLLL